MSKFLVVSGDFVKTGGMDMANFALAMHLAQRGDSVHLVTHRADAELTALPNVHVSLVTKPLNSYLLGSPVLDWQGRRAAQRFAGEVIVNGGNCVCAGVNWVHYVHSAWKPVAQGRVLKTWCTHHAAVHQEREALRKARVVIANSDRTRHDLIERMSVEPERTHTVYCGIDAKTFRPASVEAKREQRRQLGWGQEPVVAFIGGLADRRKGFDRLFAAWKLLCDGSGWDATLAVIGAGPELEYWKSLAAEQGMSDRVRFLGFRRDVPAVLGACDALVAPVRYEPYGLAVQEAICLGLPALVTRTAGVAERYPAELQELLLDDSDDAGLLASRIENWRNEPDSYSASIAALAAKLRENTWDAMASRIAALAEAQ
ncbi:MAG: glycosyltransferase [Bryobacteraceae bacterium]